MSTITTKTLLSSWSVRLKQLCTKRTMSNFEILNIDTPITPLANARRFIADCMMAVGAPKRHADILAENLVTADYRGHYSHGMNRLEFYVQDVKGLLCDPKIEPVILKESPATAWVDGQSGLGAVVGHFCMELAIKKAKQTGIAMVVAKGSNHYGIAGIYALQAIENGLMGFSCTNTSPFLVPTGAKDSALGTNPIAFGAPNCEKNDGFVLDMATTAAAVGKIEFHKRKNQPIPKGWALNEKGQIETDPTVAYDARRLMPLGGDETTSGFKGYGLGMLVEVLSGILGGAHYGPNIRKWGNFEQLADLGHCFMAIDPQHFAPGFEGRMSDMMGFLRRMEPADKSKPVLVAGDPERMHMQSVDQNGGLRYVQNQHEACERLVKELCVKPLHDDC